MIACASADNLVSVWQQAWVAQQHCWLHRATLKESTKAITSLSFAPRQLGPQLAVASEDGFVRFYEASSLLNADRWQLCNHFQVTQQSLQVLAAIMLPKPTFCTWVCCRRHHLALAIALVGDNTLQASLLCLVSAQLKELVCGFIGRIGFSVVGSPKIAHNRKNERTVSRPEPFWHSVRVVCG